MHIIRKLWSALAGSRAPAPLTDAAAVLSAEEAADRVNEAWHRAIQKQKAFADKVNDAWRRARKVAEPEERAMLAKWEAEGRPLAIPPLRKSDVPTRAESQD